MCVDRGSDVKSDVRNKKKLHKRALRQLFVEEYVIIYIESTETYKDRYDSTKHP